MAWMQATKQISTFCPLCVSRYGAKATISDGGFVALQPDPSHPTGQALWVKGKAAPELVKQAERLLRPLKRSNSKGASDPGWLPRNRRVRRCASQPSDPISGSSPLRAWVCNVALLGATEHAHASHGARG